MKLNSWFGALALLAVGGLATAAFTQGDKAAQEASAKKKAEMEMKMKAYGTPGEAHKVLNTKVGKWTVDVKIFEPGAPEPMMEKATSTVTLIMDGRYIQETVDGTFMGQPFHGVGTTGYDNIKKKYVSTWIDSMSTGIFYAEGSYDTAAKTFSFAGESPDVMAGKFVKTRSVDKMIDADHFSAQMYQPGPDGKEYMSMQIDSARAK